MGDVERNGAVGNVTWFVGLKNSGDQVEQLN